MAKSVHKTIFKTHEGLVGQNPKIKEFPNKILKKQSSESVPLIVLVSNSFDSKLVSEMQVNVAHGIKDMGSNVKWYEMKSEVNMY